MVLETAWLIHHSAPKFWLPSALFSKLVTNTVISGVLHAVVADTLRVGFALSLLYFGSPSLFLA